jgi:hypothetical protein
MSNPTLVRLPRLNAIPSLLVKIAPGRAGERAGGYQLAAAAASAMLATVPAGPMCGYLGGDMGFTCGHVCGRLCVWICGVLRIRTMLGLRLPFTSLPVVPTSTTSHVRYLLP